MFQSKKNNSLFNMIFFYFILAIFSAFIFLIFTNTYYLGVLQAKTQEQYTHKLESLSNELQNMFDEVHYTTAVFTLTDDLQGILTTHDSYAEKDYTVLIDSIATLKAFSRTQNYIHSVFIVSKKDHIVLSNYGTGRIDEFFTNLFWYDNYPTDYWLNLTPNGKEYDILPPSTITQAPNNEPINVIPLVQYFANEFNFRSPLIVNITESHIVDLLNEIKLSDNSVIFHYSNGTITSRSESDTKLNLNDSELISLSENNTEEGTDIFVQNNQKYLVVTNKSPYNNTAVCAITPYSDLRSESLSLLFLPALLFFIGIAIVTILSFLFSRKIYAPIHSVALHLRENYIADKDNDQIIKNDLDYLNQNVQLIVSDIVKLKKDLSLAIPYVCERYLLSLFDDNEILKDEEVTDFLAQYDFSFPNNAFVVVQSTLDFQKNFFETHSKTEYNAICQSNLIIANEAFSYIDNRYVFSPAINQISVILNLPDDYNKSDITSSIMKYHESLDIDDAMMIVHSGVGRVYEGLNGLKDSYTEALQAQSQITYLTTSMIRIYTNADDNISSSYYTIEEENHLINFLLQGNTQKVKEHYDSIIEKNIKHQIGTHAMKELYLQLYNTAVRVINRRNLNIYDLMGNSYINISSHVGNLHIEALHSYVQDVFIKTVEINTKNNLTTDLSNLKQYLDTHYTDEIYLDSIAEHFGKSANYMSKFIKKTLGVPFQDYIASLRIDKSKELLLSTKKSIVSISSEVGFNSRHPFIRKFKILEGVTPTEYRKLHK